MFFSKPQQPINLTLLRPVLQPILDQAFGAVFNQNGPRWAQEGHQELQRAFSKTLKNLQFLHVFGSRGLPREPQEAQEGSQEAPKEIQDPQKKRSKIDQKINKFWTNFGFQKSFKNPPKTPKKTTTKLLPYGAPFPHISGVQIIPRQKINERG